MLEIIFLLNLITYLNACADGPLGMSNGEIKDWQISASSTYPSMWDPDCHEKFSRLYVENGKAWCAKHRSDAEWLQIDLGVSAKITGVIIQGRTGKQEWVTSFMISFSTDAFQWQYITDKYGNQKVFQGNFDDHSIKHNYFDQSINARFIKFHTLQWYKHPSMRVEILGCQECKQLLGMPPYGRIKASSSLALRNKQSCQPNDGYLLSNKGWCPRKRNINDQWLELDIGHPTLVTGVVTKGKGDTNKNHWVTKYKLSFSNDSVVWTYYKDANHLEPKIFGGNADKQMERTHFLNNPFWGRFIRFHPIEWNEQIGLRAGAFGCPYTAPCQPGYFRVNENSNCIENLAFQKEAWANERKTDEKRSNRNSLKTRSFISLIQEGHPSLAVDGIDENSLHKCAIMDNYYSERPTLVINLGRMATIGGVVLKTWQGKGQDSNFAYRDYMYGLDRFSVFVDKKPITSQKNLEQNSTGNATIDNETKSKSNSQKIRLNESNLCNFVTRNNYAIFAPQIHLQCIKPLTGRYVYIQADGRSNRWSRLFSAVLCEVQVYEL
ncbi:unnamed protein product [Brachionus calyciflorus]|uniref:F5/8 type C domain-containing protein n=1 Tax=Brachionus calyciflorus TaxID=104777 RepID=A0A813T744_9BILA|nr:unnamed protein product [Brachionus calyciflorus]